VSTAGDAGAARSVPPRGSPLGDWLHVALGNNDIVHSSPLPGGYRNENLLLRTGGGHAYVLRRYRDGAACPVEAALLGRLVGTVPVPEVVAADPSGTAAGEPVLLSRFVPGVPVSTVLPGLPVEEAGRLGAAVGTVLARIGVVTFDGPGFFTGADLVPVNASDLTLPGFVADCLNRRHPGHDLSSAECAGLRDLAARSAAAASSVDGSRQLVHADLNPKNLLAVRESDGSWRVTAVLDWEFAFSGSPLCDIGNMLRFGDGYPAGYADGFLTGFVDAGGHLPDDWRAVSTALDLYALADFLTRPPGDGTRLAVSLLRRCFT
jgi:aminoglycoside phosphotransferase (APT) family kinase protein